MEKIIRWEPVEYEFNTKGKLVEKEVDDDWSPEDEDDMSSVLVAMKNGKVIQTPWGFFDVDDTMNPLRQFNIFIGDTNFTISTKVVKQICSVPGVEVFKCLSRYKFILGIGKLFEFKDVKWVIEKEVCGKINEESIFAQIKNRDLQRQVRELHKDLVNKSDEWAIYVFPNGNIEFTCGDNEHYQEHLELFRTSATYSNGVLIESQHGKKDTISTK